MLLWAECWFHGLLVQHVLTKEDWEEVKSLRINELYEAPQKGNGDAVRAIKEKVQAWVPAESSVGTIVQGRDGPGMAEVLKDKLGSSTVQDFTMQKHFDDLKDSPLWNPDLPEGEELFDNLEIKLCEDQAFRMRFMKYRVSGYLNAKLDYFEAALYHGNRIIGFANAAYAPWGDEQDDYERPFCAEVADLFRKGRRLDEETFLYVQVEEPVKNKEACGGELVFGRIELAHDFRGFGWEALLCDLASMKIIHNCKENGNAPRTCTLIGDLTRSHFVPNEEMPVPLQLKLNDGTGRSYSEGAEHAAVMRLWDGLARRFTDMGLPWPIQVNTKGLRASNKGELRTADWVV
jgi:hypothetical protein